MYKEIGGFFELELNKKINNFDEYILLNSASNSIKCIIRAFKIKKIHVPYYTCPIVFDTIQQESCEIEKYHIDDKFLPNKVFSENDYILYTNYFGVCSKNVELLSKKYSNLIIDNAQAFFSPIFNVLAQFNSARKFFGVADGSFLYIKSEKYRNKVLKLLENTKNDTTYERALYLLKRLDTMASNTYDDFVKSDKLLQQKGVCKISKLSKSILETIDFKHVKQKRIDNFNHLHNHLKDLNNLKISIQKDDIPMIYPLLIYDNEIKEILIKNKIYIPTYWKDLSFNNLDYEYILTNYLLAIPLDQRYNLEDMQKIINTVRQGNVKK